MMPIFGQILADIIILIIVALLVKHYLPSYFSEKGKSLATKEDIQEITDKIESVKHQYASQMEGLKAGLAAQSHFHKFRFEKEFEILLELSDRVVTLRDAVSGLRPMMDYVDPNESEDDRKSKRLRRWVEAANELYKVFEKRRPFYTDEIYSVVRKLVTPSQREAVQYRDGKHTDEGYWAQAEKNAGEVSRIAEEVLQAIRQRTKHWDHLDIG